MVKFRCSHCAQKIAVNDAGMGVIIQCPGCHLMVKVPAGDGGRKLPFAFPSAPAAVTPVDLPARDSMVPYLARLMMDKLVQALVSQRRNLMQTQQVGTQQMGEIEQRLARLQAKYQARVMNLERTLAMRDEEIRLLRRENAMLLRASETRPAVTAPASAALRRNVGVLLRA